MTRKKRSTVITANRYQKMLHFDQESDLLFFFNVFYRFFVCDGCLKWIYSWKCDNLINQLIGLVKLEVETNIQIEKIHQSLLTLRIRKIHSLLFPPTSRINTHPLPLLPIRFDIHQILTLSQEQLNILIILQQVIIPLIITLFQQPRSLVDHHDVVPEIKDGFGDLTIGSEGLVVALVLGVEEGFHVLEREQRVLVLQVYLDQLVLQLLPVLLLVLGSHLNQLPLPDLGVAVAPSLESDLFGLDLFRHLIKNDEKPLCQCIDLL